jgi:hypothetical protein
MRAGWIVFFWVVALAIFVLLGALNLCWGELNQDEGWYLYAARRVSQGYLPYKDFAFTQGPVFPLVYARLHPLVDRCGVAGGRKITAVLGFLASLSAAWLAGRAARRGAGRVVGVLAFILISCNVYQSYFTTVVKTYSLTALLLVLGFVALSYARSRGGGSAAFLSGFLIALAAGVRGLHLVSEVWWGWRDGHYRSRFLRLTDFASPCWNITPRARSGRWRIC